MSWRTRELLVDCLQSLRAALGGRMAAGSAEVIVVDNASGDGSAEVVRDRFPEVCLIANRETGVAELVRQGEAIGGAPLPVHVEVEEGPPGATALYRHDRNARVRRGGALDGGDGRDKGADRRYFLPQVSLQQGALVLRELTLHSAPNCQRVHRTRQ